MILEPEPLIGMQQPGEQKYNECTEYKSGCTSPVTSLHEDRIEENLHHEVFPVDVDTPPVVVKPGRKEIQFVRLWKVESEHAHQANNEMEEAGDAQI